MKINENSLTPIYIQIADQIEEDIINDKLMEGSACYSQLILAKELSVNPATAAKGINLLVSRGILEKQRGQAMMVTVGAKEKIIDRKKQTDFVEKVDELIRIAKRLNLSRSDVVKYFTERFHEDSPI